MDYSKIKIGGVGWVRLSALINIRIQPQSPGGIDLFTYTVLGKIKCSRPESLPSTRASMNLSNFMTTYSMVILYDSDNLDFII